MDEQHILDSVNLLLDISKIIALPNFVKFSSGKREKYTKIVSERECIYAFWLNNEDNIIRELNTKFSVLGVNQFCQDVAWNWHLNDNQILLYVGKTTNFKKRMKKHLMLGTKHWEQNEDNTLYKKSTACQLRAGIEKLIQDTGLKSFDFMNERISVTCVEMDNFIDRFFAEDLAVGMGKPWFNIDSER